MTNTTLQLTDLFAQNAPSFAYRQANATWLQQIIHDDSQSHGSWCFFTISEPHNLPWLVQTFAQQCTSASDKVFPTTWLRHQHTDTGRRTYGCCVGLVPLTSPRLQ